MIKLGESSISWKSKKQQTVSRSSTAAEYQSMATVVSEFICLSRLLQELNVLISFPIKILTDSKSSIKIAGNLIFHERTKHIEIDYHFTREKVKVGYIDPQFVCSNIQLADILTKGLGTGQHEFLLSKLGVLDVFQPPA